VWKEDWPEARAALTAWWNHAGPAIYVTAPADSTAEELEEPEPNVTPERRRLDIDYILKAEQWRLAHTYYGGVAAPMFNTDIGGPGSLGLFLGAHGRIAESTVWYDPCIDEPEGYPPLKLDTDCLWWRRHLELIEHAIQQANGRYLVTVPDLVENIDTLAQLRGSETVMMDMLERSAWVEERLEQVWQAYIDCFEQMWRHLEDPWGGNSFYAFQLWGPGKTAKVQCDFSCMISPRMFRKFVTPTLIKQCAYLDYAMYHLDGTQAMGQLPNLLEIEEIRAIEWTPQSGLPGGGSPEWYDLYRRIKAAGKSVQAIDVRPEEVLPLLDAVGPEGMFIITQTRTETEARELLRRTGWPQTLI